MIIKFHYQNKPNLLILKKIFRAKKKKFLTDPFFPMLPELQFLFFGLTITIYILIQRERLVLWELWKNNRKKNYIYIKFLYRQDKPHADGGH